MIVAIIQARMGSERLPGKVFKDLAGRPLLWHVVQRARALKCADRVVLATTTLPEDDVLAREALDWGIEVFRGSRDDVLDRFCRAASQYEASLVYRVNGDNPLADPNLADRLYQNYRLSPCEYLWIEGAAVGLGAELMAAEALQKTGREAVEPADREHVTTYLRRGKAGRVRPIGLPAGYPLPSGPRLTVDTDADLELMRRIYEEIYRPGRIISVEDVARLFASKPELPGLNL